METTSEKLNGTVIRFLQSDCQVIPYKGLKHMNCKEYNEKYGPLFKERERDFWAAIKDWLEKNPERFIAFQTYIPGFNDGEPCLPVISYIGAAPGFCHDHYVDSEGKTHYAEDVYTEIPNLPKKDQEYLKGKEEWSYNDMRMNKSAEDLELEETLMEGYVDFVQEYDVTGTIKLVNDRRRKNHGEPTVNTEYYQCGW